MEEWTEARVVACPAEAFAHICSLKAAAAERDRRDAERDRLDVERARLAADSARALVDLVARLAPVGPAIPTTTIKQIYDLFELARRSSKSWKAIRNRLRSFVLYFGDTQAMQLTPKKWAEYRERRKIDDVLLGRAIAPITINFELDWAKAMLTWACGEEQALIPMNPLDKAKRETVDSGRETWLTEEDLVILLSRCGLLMTAFVLVAVDTGLRISEVLKLRRDRIRFVDTEGGERIGIVEYSKRETKGKRPHMSGITARAVAALELLPPSENPFLFPSPKKKGRPYGARHIARLFRSACEKSGIDAKAAEGDSHIRAHDLRHTAASAATRRGASLLQVQRMLNHSSPAITARYVHHDEGGVVAIAELMEAGAKRELEKLQREKERRPPRRAPSVGEDRRGESQISGNA